MASSPDARRLSGAENSRLSIGAEAGRDVDQTVAATRTAVRQLLVFVGGTGLEALADIAHVMRAHDLHFGDETMAAHRPLVPHAIFVDTDIQATRKVTGNAEGEDEEVEKRRAKIEELRGMGVHVSTMFDEGRRDTLLQMGLLDQFTAGMPMEEDPQGSKTDPRMGISRYLALRGVEDDSRNPRDVARKIVAKWLETQSAFLGAETILTVVGGMHGGTGQAALPIMADVRRDMQKALRGSGTKITAERYAMTSESAGIDQARKRDGLQRKRVLNTAAGLVLMNAADVQGGYEMTPGEWVPGLPSDFTFSVNGRNPHRTVPVDGGHYVPVRQVAKHLASRILGLDMTASGRSNARLERYETTDGHNTPNEPRANLSALGVSEVVPFPDRAELTAEKRKKLIAAIFGLHEANQDEVRKMLQLLLPDNLLRSVLDNAEAPQLLPDQLGREAEIKTVADAEAQKFEGDLKTALQAQIRKSLREIRDQMNKDLNDKTKQVKRTEGLASTVAFLECSLTELDGVSRQAATMMDQECSKETLNDLKVEIEKILKKIRRFSIPIFNILGLRDNALQRLEELKNSLAEMYTRYAEMTRDYIYLRNLDQHFLNHIKEECRTLLEQANREYGEASMLHRDIRPDPKDAALQTPFDLQVPVSMDITDDPLVLRENELGDGAWTREQMLQLVESIRVNAADIDLIAKLTTDVLSASAKLSYPLTHSVALGGSNNATTTISIASVPAESRKAAEKIPVPDEASRLPVGEEGPYLVTQEFHGISMLDDAYARECLDALLETPPTLEGAKKLKDASQNDPEAKLLLNREGQFTFKGQATKLLPPIFRALAERKFREAGSKGDVVESCPGSDCGVAFYRSALEQEQNVTNCPGCRRIPGNVKKAA